GGLKIYSTMDLELQKKLEDIYDNFTEYLLGDVNKISAPALISWRRDKSGNILDENNHVIFYSQQNLLDEEFNLIIESNNHEFIDGNLVLKSNKFSTYNNIIDIADYYNIDENKNLVTY